MTHPLDATKQRRSGLATTASPRTGLDFVVSLGGRIDAAPWSDPIVVAVRYVPDDLVIAPASLRVYLSSLGGSDWDSLEHLGATVLGDIDAEIIPRWLRIRLSTRVVDEEHCVTFEQTKPDWDNRMLLARMKIE